MGLLHWLRPGIPIDWGRATGVATALLAMATVVAVDFAWWRTSDAAAHARTAQDDLDLRKTFLQVDADLNIVNRSLAYSEAGDCLKWHVLKRYWYFSETEWKVAQIDEAQRQNWIATQLPHANSRRPSESDVWLVGQFPKADGRRFGYVTDHLDEVRNPKSKRNFTEG